MSDEPIAQMVIAVALAAAVGLFLLRYAPGSGGDRGGRADFGKPFSAFVAAWLSTELATLFVPAELADVAGAIHLVAVALFAAWMVARMRWALKSAREEAT